MRMAPSLPSRATSAAMPKAPAPPQRARFGSWVIAATTHATRSANWQILRSIAGLLSTVSFVSVFALVVEGGLVTLTGAILVTLFSVTDLETVSVALPAPIELKKLSSTALVFSGLGIGAGTGADDVSLKTIVPGIGMVEGRAASASREPPLFGEKLGLARADASEVAKTSGSAP